MRFHPAQPGEGSDAPAFSKTFSKAVPSRTTTLARALMPRQPYSVAVKSDRRSGYIPCPFGKGEGLGVG